jgi:mono/diheme cytochrome c family protein
MRLWSRIYLTGIFITAGGLMLAPVSKAVPPDSAGDLFKGKCSMCHGPEGKGFSAIKTPDFTDPKWQAKHTDQEIEDTIKNGKKDTMMKGFSDKLKDDEIDSLVKYIRTLNSKK